MIIYFDGGARPNPGKMAMGIVADDGFEYFEVSGHGTNNMAEWLACLAAAGYAANLGLKTVTIRGDSMLVVNQAAGRWKIKHREFIPMRAKLLSLLQGIDVSFEHVLRDDNPAGQMIERKYAEGH